MNDQIKHEADKLTRKYKSRNPFNIAQQMGIEVSYAEIGSLKGMFYYCQRNRFIVINNELDDMTAKIVCSHEIGHDRLHQSFAKNAFLKDFGMFDMSSKPEYEANIFAAHFLLDDDEVAETANACDSFDHMLCELGTDMNLLLIKLREMNRYGYEFNIPYLPKSDFLRF